MIWRTGYILSLKKNTSYKRYQKFKHIAEKEYLESVLSEKEDTQNGINLEEMNAKLLQS